MQDTPIFPVRLYRRVLISRPLALRHWLSIILARGILPAIIGVNLMSRLNRGQNRS
jgi:hypothetical protein